MDFKDVHDLHSHTEFLFWFEQQPDDVKNAIKAEMKDYLADRIARKRLEEAEERELEQKKRFSSAMEASTSRQRRSSPRRRRRTTQALPLALDISPGS